MQQQDQHTMEQATSGPRVVCASCGRTEQEDRLAVARWSASRRDGKITVALCDKCLDALLDAE
jgi:hypothetical protein